MKKGKGYSMKAAKRNGEIFIYDDVGDGFDGVTGRSFAQDLRELGPVDTLDIFINSPGGSVFDGVAIFNQLKRHRARKTVRVDGLAASIASVIAMAGDEIVIAENGMMMIHDPWALAIGTATEMRRMADNLDKVGETILATYAARSGAAEAQLAAMMAEETWFNAEEAVELGLADRIGAEVAMAARFDLSKFRHPPESLVEAMAAQTRDPKAGERLAARLNDMIADRVTEERSEEDIVADMAREAGIETGTVRQILAGTIDCPPLQRLEGFARALDVAADDLVSAAESDGCDYGGSEDRPRRVDPKLLRARKKIRDRNLDRRADPANVAA